MDVSEIVVRRVPGGGVRTGVVLARDAGTLRVRWDDDGAEEDAKIGGATTFAARGSLRHQALVDVAPLAERLDADPLAVVLQLLREQRVPMKTAVIKDQLKVLGLDQEAVDRAWRKVQARLGKLEEVRFRSSAYKWVGPADAAPVLPEPAGAAPDRAVLGPVDEAETLAELLRDVEGPDAKAWSEALSWYASLLSGDTEATRAKERFAAKFGADPWKP